MSEPLKSSLRKLFKLLSRRDRRNAGLLLLMMLLAAAIEVLGVAAIPAFVGAVIEPEQLQRFAWFDGLISAEAGPRSLVVWGGAALALLFAVKTVFLLWNFRLQMRYAMNRRVQISRRLMRAYLNAPYSFHLRRNTSELLRNVEREVSVVCHQVIGGMLQLITKLAILVAVLIFLFVVEPFITVFWVAMFGSLAAFVVWGLGAKLKKLGLQEQAERQAMVQALYQGFGAIKETRVLGRERFFADRVDESVRRVADVVEFKQSVAKAIPPVTEFFGVCGLLLLAVSLVLMGRPNESILVTLSLFVVGLVRLKEAMSAAMTSIANLRYNLVSVGPVYDDLMRLEAKPRRRKSSGPASRLRMREGLVLKNVWHRYEAAQQHALKGVSLVVPAGAAVGFVGATGAGKSTLIDVILGLLEPEQGELLVDGQDVRKDLPAWQRTIGYVPQSIYLLDDTIRNNIALGLEEDQIDGAALAQAVQAAQLEPLLRRLPQGLATVVGEQGVRLSGGERQRIGIARALYNDPDVLVLDEATSALDNATERAIVRSVEALRGRRTVLMIAHRLSTVRNCDRLYFLKEGRLEAEGDFEQLQVAHPDFAAMAAT